MSFAGEIRLFNRTIYLDRSDTPFLTVWIDRKENGTGFFTENDCKNSLLHLIYSIRKGGHYNFYVELFIRKSGVIICQYPKHNSDELLIDPQFHPITNSPC